MTSNAINYQKYLEDVRHNKEMEAQGRESIALGKSNLQYSYANLGLGYSQLAETQRANRAQEGIKTTSVSLDQSKQSFYERNYWPTKIYDTLSNYGGTILKEGLQMVKGGVQNFLGGNGWRLNGFLTH